MKRRLVSLVIVLAVCLSLTGNALALKNDGVIMAPLSLVSVSCGLTKSGSQYRIWSTTETNLSESLTASVSLYQVVNGSEVFVTSASATATGTSVTAKKTRTLAAGTYKIYGSGSGNTSSSSDSCTVTIP